MPPSAAFQFRQRGLSAAAGASRVYQMDPRVWPTNSKNGDDGDDGGMELAPRQ
jgi:hypothetical protein